MYKKSENGVFEFQKAKKRPIFLEGLIILIDPFYSAWSQLKKGQEYFEGLISDTQSQKCLFSTSILFFRKL